MVSLLNELIKGREGGREIPLKNLYGVYMYMYEIKSLNHGFLRLTQQYSGTLLF